VSVKTRQQLPKLRRPFHQLRPVQQLRQRQVVQQRQQVQQLLPVQLHRVVLKSAYFLFVVAILQAKDGVTTAMVGWQHLGVTQLQATVELVVVRGVQRIEDYCKDTKMFDIVSS